VCACLKSVLTAVVGCNVCVCLKSVLTAVVSCTMLPGGAFCAECKEEEAVGICLYHKDLCFSSYVVAFPVSEVCVDKFMADAPSSVRCWSEEDDRYLLHVSCQRVDMIQFLSSNVANL